ncbi:hypothetical protein DPMN_032920 [Dreissena polymorpha]|uniref:Uncharacterized protein n=1 Tax=Dreissena polymorpha TaxID=45954 RepID=A0A9D4M549_DREPO|nr:hypothetical protein DPMN_032920 [Dreissena polymorpha]
MGVCYESIQLRVADVKNARVMCCVNAREMSGVLIFPYVIEAFALDTTYRVIYIGRVALYLVHDRGCDATSIQNHQESIMLGHIAHLGALLGRSFLVSG